MENKINCSRHLVVTGKVITCAAFSSAATYPCRIPRRSQLFFRLYFRLTPVIEKGWTSRVPDKSSSDGEEPFDEEGGKKNRGEKLWSWFQLRTRFGLQQCVFLGVRGCLLAKIRGFDGVERWRENCKTREKSTLSRCSRALHCILFSILYFDFFSVSFFFFFFEKWSKVIFK